MMYERNKRSTAFSLAMLVAWTTPAAAQELLHQWFGDAGGDDFGWSVSGAGDANADGYDDLIVGAPCNDTNGNASGMARVFSGKDGTVLCTVYGDTDCVLLGYSVDGIGDVNQDGHDDFLVGEPGDSTNGLAAGAAIVYSGQSGMPIYSYFGTLFDFLGKSVGCAGKVDEDSIPDFVVSGEGGEYARVFSGVDGSEIWTLTAPGPTIGFGKAVSGAGDVNADGYADVIVGDLSGSSGDGSAWVFSGRDSNLLYQFDGTDDEALARIIHE